MSHETYEPSKRTVYLAAPLFTPHQKEVIAEVREVMERVGYDVFSPLDESKDIWKGRPPAECGSEERQAVMQMNKMGINSSDLVFAWLGGWDPFGALDDMLSQCWPRWSEFHDDDVDGLMAAVKRASPALPDTGVVWELGYAYANGVPVLAYLHRGEEGRNFNLMLSETVDATARGLTELEEQLRAFLEVPTGSELADAMVSRALASEGEDFSG